MAEKSKLTFQTTKKMFRWAIFAGTSKLGKVFGFRLCAIIQDNLFTRRWFSLDVSEIDCEAQPFVYTCKNTTLPGSFQMPVIDNCQRAAERKKEAFAFCYVLWHWRLLLLLLLFDQGWWLLLPSSVIP
jgi:hypothetical protein